ncbi:MAG: transposase family protein, partial [Candidatus Accumulibacter sp.]|nr:transposase family protein [Accumulibacter sp.]
MVGDIFPALVTFVTLHGCVVTLKLATVNELEGNCTEEFDLRTCLPLWAMKTKNKGNLVQVCSAIPDPQAKERCPHDFVELLVISTVAVLCGADNFEEIARWTKEREDWLKGSLKLENGVASHETFARVFGLIDREAFKRNFRNWVGAWLPALRVGKVSVENGLDGSLELSFDEDHVGAPLRNADHNLAWVQRMALTLLQQSTTAGLDAERLLARTSDSFRAKLLGLLRIDATVLSDTATGSLPP